MIKTVVTGGSGFIGKRLLSRYSDPVSCLSHDEIRFGHSYNSDKMFFLSTYGNMAYHTDASMMLHANVIDLITVLNGFKGWFCYLSSSSVTLPVQTPYSRNKRAAEEILQSLPELQSCIVRPYSVTGRGEQPNHLIPTLIRSCIHGEAMDFVPDATHDFIDVDDVVNGLLIFSKIGARGIFEFGNGVAVTNQEVRELVETVTGKKANVRSIGKMREYDNPDWRCKVPNDYWQPTKSLRQSIQEMVEVYKIEHA